MSINENPISLQEIVQTNVDHEITEMRMRLDQRISFQVKEELSKVFICLGLNLVRVHVNSSTQDLLSINLCVEPDRDLTETQLLNLVRPHIGRDWGVMKNESHFNLVQVYRI